MNVTTGKNCDIHDDVRLGVEYTQDAGRTSIGDDAVIRSGSTIYGDVAIGDGFVTGHSVLVREYTTIGDDVVLGTKSVIDGHVDVGDDVKIETGVYLPPETEVGDAAFIGPYAVFTNDEYPQRLREQYEPKGPTLHESVTIGANATLLPDVEIGEGSFVGAGSVVTSDVPPWSLAVGNPAEVEPLPDELRDRNTEQ